MIKPTNPRRGAPTKTTSRPLTMRIRVNQREQNSFNAAADLAGLTVSSWCRMVLRKTAAADLHAAGKDTNL